MAKFKNEKGYNRINFLSKSEKDKRQTAKAKANVMADGKPRSFKLKKTGATVKVSPKTKSYDMGSVKTGDANIEKSTMTISPLKKTGYKADDRETGNPKYGKPGGGTNKEMRGLLSDARSQERDITAPNKKGLRFRAGTTTYAKGDDKITQGSATFKAPDLKTREVNVSTKKSVGDLNQKGDVQVTKGGKVDWLPKTKVKRGQSGYKIKIKQKGKMR